MFGSSRRLSLQERSQTSLGVKLIPPDEYENMDVDEICLAIGEKMHFIRPLPSDDPDNEACKTFVGAYYRHVLTKPFLLLTGEPGQGKSSFAKEIASMVVSKGGKTADGYFYAMSNQQFLTMDMLYGCMDESDQYSPGPLGEMIQDARTWKDSIFVFIIDQYNRGSDLVLSLSKVWDSKLEGAGPNERSEKYKYRRVSNRIETEEELPSNIKFIFTGNHEKGDDAGEERKEDSALELNRLAGAEVSFPDGKEYSFEKNAYPGNVIIKNMKNRLNLSGHKGYAYSTDEIEDIVAKVEEDFAGCNKGQGLMPGKIVSLVYDELDSRIKNCGASSGMPPLPTSHVSLPKPISVGLTSTDQKPAIVDVIYYQFFHAYPHMWKKFTLDYEKYIKEIFKEYLSWGRMVKLQGARARKQRKRKDPK